MNGKAIMVTRPGSARPRWGVVTPFGISGVSRTAKDAERKTRKLFRWMRRHEWRLDQ